jgi:hypothetical protein
VTELAPLTRNYRTAFLRYLSRRDEPPLHTAYEIGRSAIEAGISLLDLVRIHHEVLLEALRDTSSEELTTVATGAAEFLLEVLATYDMAQRGFRGEG